MPRSRILFISFCTPSPTGTGWEQRAFRFVSAYASFAKVSCWMKVTHDDPDLERTKDVARLCADIKVFTPDMVYSAPNHTIPAVYSHYKYKRRLLSLKPFLASEPYRKGFLLDLYQATNNIDLVHFDRNSRYLRPLLRCRSQRIVCDLDEVPWIVRQPRQLHKNPVWQPITLSTVSVLIKPHHYSFSLSLIKEDFKTIMLCEGSL